MNEKHGSVKPDRGLFDTAYQNDEGDGLYSQAKMMLQAFWQSPVRNALIGIGTGIFILIVLIAIGQVAINRWNVPFYNALSQRDLNAFFHQLLIFFAIVGSILVLNVSQTWLNMMFTLKLRDGLARDLVGQWLQSGRALRLTRAGEIGVNPDQRLHEDARHLAETTGDLGINLLQSTIILISFVGVLWSLSSGFVFHVQGYSFSIPGYMVWAAILYAGSASLLTWFVGRSLVSHNASRYAREADFRFSLMRVNEHLDSITMARGEADERRRIERDLDAVLAAIKRIVVATTNLTWVTAGYGWITMVVPILVAAPVYFAGDLTFGGLMMAVGAFSQVHNSLRWFVANFGAIADWRATLLRVASFRRAIIEMDNIGYPDRQIERVVNADEVLTMVKLSVTTPDGCIDLVEEDVAIHPGDRVLISGATEAERSLFFHAFGGLWSWGSGVIGMPSGDRMVFIPQAPYIPPGDLVDAVVYPLDRKEFSQKQVEDVLRLAGLERLLPQLNRVLRWDRTLTDDEQQSLVFSRLILQKPNWVIIDGVLEGMDEEERQRAYAILTGPLKDAAIIYIGRGLGHGGLLTQQLHVKAEHCAKPRPQAQKH